MAATATHTTETTSTDWTSLPCIPAESHEKAPVRANIAPVTSASPELPRGRSASTTRPAAIMRKRREAAASDAVRLRRARPAVVHRVREHHPRGEDLLPRPGRSSHGSPAVIDRRAPPAPRSSPQ